MDQREGKLGGRPNGNRIIYRCIGARQPAVDSRIYRRHGCLCVLSIVLCSSNVQTRTKIEPGHPGFAEIEEFEEKIGDIDRSEQRTGFFRAVDGDFVLDPTPEELPDWNMERRCLREPTLPVRPV